MKTVEKKIFKFRQCIFAILQLSPIGKGRGSSFEQTLGFFIQGALMEIFKNVMMKKLVSFKYLEKILEIHDLCFLYGKKETNVIPGTQLKYDHDNI